MIISIEFGSEFPGGITLDGRCVCDSRSAILAGWENGVIVGLDAGWVTDQITRR